MDTGQSISTLDSVPASGHKSISRPTFYWVIAVGILATLLALVGGKAWGYKVGFQAAYVPEHSHYLFEKKRADAFDKRIKTNRRCVDHLTKNMSDVEGSGFYALGQVLGHIGLLSRGMMDCNRESAFGVPSQSELNRIIPTNND